VHIRSRGREGGAPAPAGRNSPPRGGAIDNLAGVRQKHDSVHHCSKGKRQGNKKLTTDSRRCSIRVEKEGVLAAVEIGCGHGEIQKLGVWGG